MKFKMISKIIILNKTDLSQVNEVTEIHKNVLGFSALSNLGLPFLSRFYKSILSKESQKIITINQGIVLGFISLSFTNQSYLSSLLSFHLSMNSYLGIIVCREQNILIGSRDICCTVKLLWDIFLSFSWFYNY